VLKKSTFTEDDKNILYSYFYESEDMFDDTSFISGSEFERKGDTNECTTDLEGEVELEAKI